MPFPSHFARMRSVVSGLSVAGSSPYVWTDASLRDDVEGAGGQFVDLFARFPIDGLDHPGIPRRLNCVTFAGRYAAEILEEIRKIRPTLVLYDSFAVIGYVVGISLGIPFVSVCAGHNVHAGAFLEDMKARLEPRVSQNCRRAVRALRERHGIHDASPYMLIHATSPFLNLCCEPRVFLNDAARRAFEPVACIGSILSDDWQCPDSVPVFGPVPAGTMRVYVSFGTVVWRSFHDEALAAMQAIARALAARPEARAVFSLGGHSLPEKAIASIRKPNVQIMSFVPQKQALREADVFITHHGLNSTHEAIYSRVAMISYPFHWDQPGQARTCQELGVAIPLVDGPPLTQVTHADVTTALDWVSRNREHLQERLAAAREYEEQTIESRPEVIRRILDLAAGPSSRPQRAQSNR